MDKEKSIYIVFDERAKVMPNEHCTCLLATSSEVEALKFAKEYNGVVFKYLTNGSSLGYSLEYEGLKQAYKDNT